MRGFAVVAVALVSGLLALIRLEWPDALIVALVAGCVVWVEVRGEARDVR